MRKKRSILLRGSGDGRELVGERYVVAGVEHAGVAENLQVLVIEVVHEEKRDTVVAVEIAGGEHLAVAFEIREAELVRAEHAQETGGAAETLPPTNTGSRRFEA